MPSFVLLTLHRSGIRNIKDTIGRAEAFEDDGQEKRRYLEELFWTMGRYDVIAVFEAPDDVSAAALALAPPRLAVYGRKCCVPFRSRR